MSAHALPALPAAGFSRPLFTRRAARLIGYAILAAFAALHWGLLVAPGAGGRMLLAVAAGLAAGVALGACARLPGSARHVAAAGVTLAAVLLTLAAAGIPARLLAPTGWGDLAAGLTQGVQALPDLRIPYSGVDDWPRLTLLAIGGALAVLGAAGAFWPARGPGRAGHVAGLVTLMVLYAVPAVDLVLGQPLLRGAAFAAGIAAFLWLERVLVAGAAAAGIALVAALGLGLAAAPSVDRARPWLDYQRLAQSLAPAAPLTFDFTHAYGPLDWPRDGRDLLRIKARRATYWKAENVDEFDGRRWRASPSLSTARTPLSDEVPAGSGATARWRERIQVSVQGLGGHDAVTAGTTLGLVRPPSAAVARASPGTFALEDALKRGDSYAADVYVPRPTPAQMATAGTDYGQLSPLYTTLGIRTTARGQANGLPELADVRFAPFDGRGARADLLTGPDGIAYAGAGALLRDSDYARSWALAQRLAARSRTPYEYARRILAFLGTGFAYSESPPRHAVPLEAFLFDDRLGYCQHFSGAMALLLRMGGVPARVAGGFSPGAYDRRRRDYVVRDLDAHSWVEAYFPGYGWVTFDPTPSASPARSQLINVDLPSFDAPRGAGGVARRGDVPEAGPRAAGAESGGGPSPAAILAGLAVLALAGTAVAAGAGRVRRPGPGGGAGAPGDEQLAELRRALRRAGRPAQDAVTLTSLEGRLGADGPAAAYLRALRERRYGFGGPAPTAGQRRGLRRALAQGLGWTGRLRALWALPPRPGGWRGLLK
ncbi:MAG: protein-glutamine gamma-glutamyltransferase [Solirubrobacteraceae bacterium]|nr:protein-glutamine gamma-glutamyltransferase [Solirubrobacteraceae bacterium]